MLMRYGRSKLAILKNFREALEAWSEPDVTSYRRSISFHCKRTLTWPDVTSGWLPDFSIVRKFPPEYQILVIFSNFATLISQRQIDQIPLFKRECIIFSKLNWTKEHPYRWYMHFKQLGSQESQTPTPNQWFVRQFLRSSMHSYPMNITL